MTDADTLANHDDLWRLVHLVQETIPKTGYVKDSHNTTKALRKIRELADELDPENGRY